MEVEPHLSDHYQGSGLVQDSVRRIIRRLGGAGVDIAVRGAIQAHVCDKSAFLALGSGNAPGGGVLFHSPLGVQREQTSSRRTQATP